MDELAVKRFERKTNAEDITPTEALSGCLADIGKRKIRSVYIVVVTEEDDFGHYSGGPDVGTIEQAWIVLQRACLQVIGRMRSV